MKIDVDIRGIDALKKKMAGWNKEIDLAVDKTIKITAITLRTEVVKAINSGPASGHVYTKSNPTRTHQASSPGEAPMADSGGLARSVFMEVKPMQATIGSRLVYAAALEYGTRRMGERPMWRPAAERARAKMPALLNRQIEKAINK